MGFPGQFRIPGHSGTDQKHKKAFTKWRKWQREDALTYESGRKTSQRTGQYVSEHKMSRKANKWLLLLGLPIVLLALATGSWLIFQAGDATLSSFELTATITLSPKNDTERLRAYEHYQALANQKVAQGDYDAAKVNYMNALAMAPYGKSARLGLTEVLEYYCENSNSYCVEAIEQRAFVDEMGWEG